MSTTESYCSKHPERKAKIFCDIENEPLCKECMNFCKLNNHNFFFLVKEDVAEDDDGEPIHAKRCQIHDRAFDYLCEHCNILVCEQCSPYHQDHQMNHISFYANKIRQYYKDLDGMFNDFITEYEELKRKFSERNDELMTFQNKKLEQIDLYFDDIIRRVEAKRNDLKSQVSASFSHENEEIRVRLQEVDNAMTVCGRKHGHILKDMEKMRSMPDIRIVCDFYLNTFLTKRMNIINELKAFNSINIDHYANDFNKKYEFEEIRFPNIGEVLRDMNVKLSVEQNPEFFSSIEPIVLNEEKMQKEQQSVFQKRTAVPTTLVEDKSRQTATVRQSNSSGGEKRSTATFAEAGPSSGRFMYNANSHFYGSKTQSSENSRRQVSNASRGRQETSGPIAGGFGSGASNVYLHKNQSLNTLNPTKEGTSAEVRDSQASGINININLDRSFREKTDENITVNMKEFEKDLARYMDDQSMKELLDTMNLKPK